MKTQAPAHVSPLAIGGAALVSPALQWIALLCLGAAFLQGGIVKAVNFSGAVGEMRHFGLAPAAPLAVATIAVEIGASLLILTGYWRWLGALTLAAFTLFATFIASRYWAMAMPDRLMVMNSFFEHLGLIGGLVLVAVHDLDRNRTH